MSYNKWSFLISFNSLIIAIVAFFYAIVTGSWINAMVFGLFGFVIYIQMRSIKSLEALIENVNELSKTENSKEELKIQK